MNIKSIVLFQPGSKERLIIAGTSDYKRIFFSNRAGIGDLHCPVVEYNDGTKEAFCNIPFILVYNDSQEQ